jgi:hypothetical protein
MIAYMIDEMSSFTNLFYEDSDYSLADLAGEGENPAMPPSWIRWRGLPFPPLSLNQRGNFRQVKNVQYLAPITG